MRSLRSSRAGGHCGARAGERLCVALPALRFIRVAFSDHTGPQLSAAASVAAGRREGTHARRVLAGRHVDLTATRQVVDLAFPLGWRRRTNVGERQGDALRHAIVEPYKLLLNHVRGRGSRLARAQRSPAVHRWPRCAKPCEIAPPRSCLPRGARTAAFAYPTRRHPPAGSPWGILRPWPARSCRSGHASCPTARRATATACACRPRIACSTRLCRRRSPSGPRLSAGCGPRCLAAAMADTDCAGLRHPGTHVSRASAPVAERRDKVGRVNAWERLLTCLRSTAITAPSLPPGHPFAGVLPRLVGAPHKDDPQSVVVTPSVERQHLMKLHAAYGARPVEELVDVINRQYLRIPRVHTRPRARSTHAHQPSRARAPSAQALPSDVIEFIVSLAIEVTLAHAAHRVPARVLHAADAFGTAQRHRRRAVRVAALPADQAAHDQRGGQRAVPAAAGQRLDSGLRGPHGSLRGVADRVGALPRGRLPADHLPTWCARTHTSTRGRG
jgi:hypothetical protein